MLSPTYRVLEEIPNCELRADVPLAKHTSLGVGGPADVLAIPDDRAAVERLLSVCRANSFSVLFLGKGFNTLVRDGGFRGVVIALWRLQHLEATEDGELIAEAGVSHSRVTHYCSSRGLSGLEFAAGIPGTVGGWIAMNAGVPDREMCDVLARVDTASDRGQESRTADDLAFRYRGSDLPDRSAVLAGHFRLSQDTPDAIKRRVANHLETRSRTQPIDRPSCGSVFKNPPGDFAGRLIEDAGLKGWESGGASFSTLHANFIVTRRGTRAEDVLALIHRAQETVLERSGVSLEPEVRIVGDDA